MSLSGQLRRAGRNPPLPLTLSLTEGHLQIDAWLRVLPGKRLVGRGSFKGQPVVAKLFVGDNAARHAARERRGIGSLEKAGIRTPKLIAQGSLAGGGEYILSAFLGKGQTLQILWDELASTAPGDPEASLLLGMALRAIADMHARGLLQGDLHLGNFLLSDDELYVIDGDAVEAVSPGEPLQQGRAEQNLALFFAQLPPAWDELREQLLIEYLMVNGHRALVPERLQQLVGSLRERRLADYLGKTVRDCSLFAVRRNWWTFSSVQRKSQTELEELMLAPDQALAGDLLKDGGSSTVARWRIGGRSLLVKRYNIKGFAHWLRRFWRPSRAWHAWQAGHKLRFLGLHTPEPLAMIEERFGPLRRRAWLVTEFSPGQELLSLLGDGNQLPPPEVGQAVLEAFTALYSARISHGDCKATNFLWDGSQLSIIDLDAMQSHVEGSAWQRAWSADRSRFLRNWPAQSPLAGWFDERLPN